jgi:hypothetical protein
MRLESDEGRTFSIQAKKLQDFATSGSFGQKNRIEDWGQKLDLVISEDKLRKSSHTLAITFQSSADFH